MDRGRSGGCAAPRSGGSAALEPAPIRRRRVYGTTQSTWLAARDSAVLRLAEWHPVPADPRGPGGIRVVGAAGPRPPSTYSCARRRRLHADAGSSIPDILWLLLGAGATLDGRGHSPCCLCSGTQDFANMGANRSSHRGAFTGRRYSAAICRGL